MTQQYAKTDDHYLARPIVFTLYGHPGSESVYLEPTAFLDHDGDGVARFARDTMRGATTPTATAIKLFHAVRDGICHDPYFMQMTPSRFSASDVPKGAGRFVFPRPRCPRRRRDTPAPVGLSAVVNRRPLGQGRAGPRHRTARDHQRAGHAVRRDAGSAFNAVGPRTTIYLRDRGHWSDLAVGSSHEDFRGYYPASIGAAQGQDDFPAGARAGSTPSSHSNKA